MFRVTIIFGVWLTCLGICVGQEKKDHPAPLFDDLGSYHFPVTTKSKLAQRYIDQGMVLMYGFNHKEAIRSFRAAAKLDPKCAMAYWGESLCYGPNINNPMPVEAIPQALDALQGALKNAPHVSKREQAYINALSKRYSGKPMPSRAPLDQAYADAMGKVHKAYPDDLDAATLFAEALMDTTPWDYWQKNGQPKAETREILKALEFVLAKNPDHPGANHYYIHAVEASPHPERGLPSAHRLKNLCPGAGHLVHMPAHIYLRMGMYHEASLANVRAIAADESYITQCRVQGFYPALYYSHNVHFLCYCLNMEGRSKECLEAGRKTTEVLHKHDVSDMPYMQWLKATPLFTLVRFGKWQDILVLKKPANKALFEKAMWHYARGMAFVRTNQEEKAESEAKHLHKLIESEGVTKLETPLFPGVSVIKIADTLLQAELAGLQDQPKKRIELLELAVHLQDELPYMEPPFWYFPVRQALGAALMEAGQADKAEAVYRQDLEKRPHNGWSLFGLLQSLRAQGKTKQATEIQRQFREAWQYSDVVLTSSWF